MYTPEPFSVADSAEIYALMRDQPFAAFISAGPAGLDATHVPTVFKVGGENL